MMISKMILAFAILNLVLLLVIVSMVAGQPTGNMVPPLPGVMPSLYGKPHLILAQDIDYPPYAFLGVPPEGDYDVAGFGHDFAKGMAKTCGMDITTVQTNWANCWDSGKIGIGLRDGYFHACMTYTHTAGQRNRFVEFSNGILQANKPAGLLVRLKDGKPEIDPKSDLKDVKVVDVKGWAPTSDGLNFVKNRCTLKPTYFLGFEMVTPEDSYKSKSQKKTFTIANDVALAMLLDGAADAVWLYADQAQYYDCSQNPDKQNEHDCEMWAGFKKDFAYIHTGLYGHTVNGTTLTLAKKGSGISEIVNPCIQKFLKTKEYKTICDNHKLTSTCYKNEFFGSDAGKRNLAGGGEEYWTYDTNKLTTECADGYCNCDSFAA